MRSGFPCRAVAFHPVDGNKRAALASGLVFLHQNGIDVDDPDERLYDVMIKIATKTIGKPEIATTLRALIAPASD